tara:strand:+ start:58 stop:606 length:549 start_codon:yes stop_codon:yes gene_type:complete
MRRLVALVVVSILAVSPGTAAESGVNEQFALEGTDIDSVEFQSVAPAGESFSISVHLSEEARENGTTVGWITQVCINSGVCYAPETHSLESEDGSIWTGAIVPDETVTYVNWKFVLQHEGESQTDVPETGFGWKVWSDCWHDNGTWGGSSTECQEERGILPGFSVSAAVFSTSMAALMARRD